MKKSGKVALLTLLSIFTIALGSALAGCGLIKTNDGNINSNNNGGTTTGSQEQKPGGQEQKPGGENVAVKLSAPTNVRVENGKIKWDNAQACEGYEVSIDGAITKTTEKSFSFDFEHGNTYDIQVRTLGDGELLTDSDWSEVSYQHVAEDFKQFQIVKQAMEEKLAEVYPNYTDIEFTFANEQFGKTVVFFNAIDENGEAVSYGSAANFTGSFEELAEDPSIITDATSWQLAEGGFRNDELTNYILENMLYNSQLNDMQALGWEIDEVLSAGQYLTSNVDERVMSTTMFVRLERGSESEIMRVTTNSSVKKTLENLDIDVLAGEILTGNANINILLTREETSELGQDVSNVISKYGLNEFGGSASASSVSEQNGGQTRIGGGVQDFEQGM